MPDVYKAEEASLSPEQQVVFRQLVADYKEAKRLVPGFTGGLSAKIAGELVRLGWRKQA